jgi:hypothetical protein
MIGNIWNHILQGSAITNLLCKVCLLTCAFNSRPSQAGIKPFVNDVSEKSLVIFSQETGGRGQDMQDLAVG